jgi:predicted secreted protein
VLPFGLRTQQDDEDVTLGTVPSAPRGRHMRRALLWTTVVTSVIIGLVFVVVDVLGFGFDDLPVFVPT